MLCFNAASQELPPPAQGIELRHCSFAEMEELYALEQPIGRGANGAVFR